MSPPGPHASSTTPTGTSKRKAAEVRRKLPRLLLGLTKPLVHNGFAEALLRGLLRLVHQLQLPSLAHAPNIRVRPEVAGGAFALPSCGNPGIRRGPAAGHCQRGGRRVHDSLRRTAAGTEGFIKASAAVGGWPGSLAARQPGINPREPALRTGASRADGFGIQLLGDPGAHLC